MSFQLSVPETPNPSRLAAFIRSIQHPFGHLPHAWGFVTRDEQRFTVHSLPAGFPIEVRAACLPRFHFPGLQQGRLPILSHLDDEIREA